MFISLGVRLVLIPSHQTIPFIATQMRFDIYVIEAYPFRKAILFEYGC